MREASRLTRGSAWCWNLAWSRRGPFFASRHENARLLTQQDKGRQRPHIQLGHDRLAMNLDGPFVNAEITGDLLVQPAAHDVLEHLAFAAADGIEAHTQGSLAKPLCTRLLVAS